MGNPGDLAPVDGVYKCTCGTIKFHKKGERFDICPMERHFGIVAACWTLISSAS